MTHGRPKSARDGRGGDAVLARAGLGDDARLAHALGEQDLAEAIVDLVRAGVIEVLALEIDLRAAEMLRQPLGEIERIGPPHIVLQQAVELGMKRGIVLHVVVGLLQLAAAAASASRRRNGRRNRRNGRPRRDRGDSCSAARRSCRACNVRVRSVARGGDEGRDLFRALAARRVLDTGRRIDELRARDLDRARDVLRIEPAGKAEGPRNVRPRRAASRTPSPSRRAGGVHPAPLRRTGDSPPRPHRRARARRPRFGHRSALMIGRPLARRSRPARGGFVAMELDQIGRRQR